MRRVVLCSGKVYFDLLEHRRAEGDSTVALVRIEELYPFPADDYQAILERYAGARDIVWCQEEPQNQGAWYQIRHRLQAPLDERRTLSYAGRESAAAPATGLYALHQLQQSALVARCPEPEDVMTLEVRVPQLPESVADATLVTWHKKAGDAVARDENLADLETDKVVLEVPAPTAGILKSLDKEAGATVTSGELLAVIDELAVAAERPGQARKPTRGSRPIPARPRPRRRRKLRRCRRRRANPPASFHPLRGACWRRTSSRPGRSPAADATAASPRATSPTTSRQPLRARRPAR